MYIYVSIYINICINIYILQVLRRSEVLLLQHPARLGVDNAEGQNTAMLRVYPTFSCTVLGPSAELLVSQGGAPSAYSCISTLRCRATAVSSERLCV